MIIYDELEEMWKEVTVVYFNVWFQHLLGGTPKNFDKCKLGPSSGAPEYKVGDLTINSRCWVGCQKANVSDFCVSKVNHKHIDLLRSTN
jgi:hypothetical protein